MEHLITSAAVLAAAFIIIYAIHSYNLHKLPPGVVGPYIESTVEFFGKIPDIAINLNVDVEAKANMEKKNE